MTTINKTREIFSPVDRVWEIASHTDNDQKFWTNIGNIKVLGRKGDTIEREANVGPRDYSQKSRRTLVLYPMKSLELTLSGRSLLGGRAILLTPLGRNTRVDVSWNLELKVVPSFVLELVKSQIAEATEKTLAKIVEEAERSRETEVP